MQQNSKSRLNKLIPAGLTKQSSSNKPITVELKKTPKLKLLTAPRETSSGKKLHKTVKKKKKQSNRNSLESKKKPHKNRRNHQKKRYTFLKNPIKPSGIEATQK